MKIISPENIVFPIYYLLGINENIVDESEKITQHKEGVNPDILGNNIIVRKARSVTKILPLFSKTHNLITFSC